MLNMSSLFFSSWVMIVTFFDRSSIVCSLDQAGYAFVIYNHRITLNVVRDSPEKNPDLVREKSGNFMLMYHVAFSASHCNRTELNPLQQQFVVLNMPHRPRNMTLLIGYYHTVLKVLMLFFEAFFLFHCSRAQLEIQKELCLATTT